MVSLQAIFLHKHTHKCSLYQDNIYGIDNRRIYFNSPLKIVNGFEDSLGKNVDVDSSCTGAFNTCCISNELTAYQPLLESLLLVIAVLQTRNFLISFTETFISNITPAYK